MIDAGAHGTTADQIRSVVHPDLPRTAFLSAVNRAGLDLASRNGESKRGNETKRVEVQSVNGVWAQRGYEFLPDYLDRLAMSFGAGLHLVDFIQNTDGARTSINRWVSQGTLGRIGELLPAGNVTADTRFLLVNALYYWASWAKAFDAHQTHDAPFHLASGETAQVPTMHGQDSVGFGEGDGFRVVELPYYGGHLSMYVVLPEEGKFADVASRLGSESVERACSTLRRESVKIALPKFSFAWGASSLKRPLQELGIANAFASEADFSEIEPKRELRLADVVHATFIAVGEQGTEAAAATAAQGALAGVEAAPLSFVADRPFMFFVRDSSGMLLFQGQVIDPRQH